MMVLTLRENKKSKSFPIWRNINRIVVFKVETKSGTGECAVVYEDGGKALLCETPESAGEMHWIQSAKVMDFHEGKKIYPYGFCDLRPDFKGNFSEPEVESAKHLFLKTKRSLGRMGRCQAGRN